MFLISRGHNLIQDELIGGPLMGKARGQRCLCSEHRLLLLCTALSNPHLASASFNSPFARYVIGSHAE